MRFFLFILLITFFCNLHPTEITFDLSSNFEEDSFIIKEEPFFLELLTFESDIYIQNNEFRYLVSIEEGKIISSEDLKNACINLYKKRKFKKIKIIITSGVEGKRVKFLLKGLWTFNKLKLYGFLSGKDFYRKYYLLDQGEDFSLEKHKHFLKKIKNEFWAEGYLNGYISDYLAYDKKTKSVTVHLTLNRGKRFVIEEIIYQIPDVDNFTLSETESIKTKIEKFFINKLVKEFYSKKILIKETKHLKRLLMQKGFFNSTLELEEFINYKTKKIKLVYNIKLGSRKKFIFFGNNFFSKSLLMEKIKAFGKSTAMLPTSVFIDEIIQTYSKKGFSDIDVKASQEKDKVFFVIRENKRKVVDFVEINGSKTFESSYLLKKFFKKFHKPRYFDAEILKDSINRMISFYIKQGFWDAKAIYQDLVYLKDTDKNIFIIAIDEGKRRYLKDVIIENYSELESSGPFSRFKKGKKIPFDFNLLKSQKLWLMNYFQKQGFMYIEIKPEIIEEDEAIILKWKVSSNVDQVKFGKTIILGSNKFGFNKILRELSYKEGETWDKQKLEKSIFKLRKLDIFESISLYPENISKKEDGKYVLLKVRLDDPYEFRFRAGFQQVSKNFTFRSGTTYKLGGSFIYKNPFNLGDLFRTDLDFTRYYRNMMFQYGVPWLFNMPVSGLFKAYNNKYIQPIFIGNKDPLYEAVQQGFLVGLSKKHLKWDVGLNLGFEWMETTKLSDSVARAIDFSRELVDKKVPYFFIEPNLMIDNLDDKLNPKIGTFTVLSIKGMQPLKQEFIEFGFLKFLFSQSMFFPLGDIVFGLRLRMGHIFSQKFNSIMPVERFYLGGANSVRSYDPDMCPPLGVYVNKHNQVEHVPRGGRSMVNLNLEVRFPIFKEIIGVVFQDVGTLIEKSLREIENSKIVAGTGFGLRYNTAVGPLRFDIGWKLKKREIYNSSFAWFLTFGHAF